MAFKCPVCSSPTRVTDTRGVERKRACKCGNTFKTYEHLVDNSLRVQNTKLKNILRDMKERTLRGLK